MSRLRSIQFLFISNHRSSHFSWLLGLKVTSFLRIKGSSEHDIIRNPRPPPSPCSSNPTLSSTFLQPPPPPPPLGGGSWDWRKKDDQQRRKKYLCCLFKCKIWRHSSKRMHMKNFMVWLRIWKGGNWVFLSFRLLRFTETRREEKKRKERRKRKRKEKERYENRKAKEKGKRDVKGKRKRK